MQKNNLFTRCVDALFFGVGGAVGSRVFMALANIFISRIIGKEVYGQFSSINTTVNMFVVFSGSSVSATLTRYISASGGNKEKQGMYIRTFSVFCICLSCLLSSAMFIFAKQISEISSGTDTLTPYFRIVAITVLFAAISSVEQSIMLGFERFAASSLVQLIRCFLFLVLGVVLSIKFGLLGAAYALVITHMSQYIMSRIINYKYLKNNSIYGRFVFNNEIRDIIINFAFPAFVSGLFVLPVNWCGNAILTKCEGFGALAIFSVANQWMTYITYIPGQLGQMRPIYTELYINGRITELKGIFRKMTVYTTGVAFLIGAVIIAGSKIILNFHGKGYENGQPAFILMIIAAIIYTAQVQTGFIIQSFGKMWFSLGINALWGICLLSVFWSLKSLGATGYAIAYVVAYLVIFFLQMYIVTKTFSGGKK